MKHLILPITIEGTEYCVKHGNTTPKWRTVSILSGDLQLQSAEDDDVWNSDGDGVNGGGLIRFATCCIWKAKVKFLLESDQASDQATYYGDVSINGAVVDSFTRITTPGEYVDIDVDLDVLGLMGRPCGNRWDISANYEDGSAAYIAVAILDVTFGPPV